jgi:hypothetical protein
MEQAICSPSNLASLGLSFFCDSFYGLPLQDMVSAHFEGGSMYKIDVTPAAKTLAVREVKHPGTRAKIEYTSSHLHTQLVKSESSITDPIQ